MLIKNRKKYLFAAIVLFFAFVNPYTEDLEFTQPIPFMYGHYSLFISGMLIGYCFIRLSRYYILPAIALSITWHLPYPFALAASSWSYRLLSDASFLASGLVFGSSLEKLSWRLRGILLGLWAFADNLLSVIFILSPSYYSESGISISPYHDFQFPLLGLSMIMLMNSLVGIVVYLYSKNMVASIREVR